MALATATRFPLKAARRPGRRPVGFSLLELLVVLFIIGLAAAEAAIGLAILVVLFRNRRSIAVQELNTLKG